MGWIDRWDVVLLAIAAYVGVMTLVRLMMRRRDQNVADVERQLQSLRNQSNNRPSGSKGRDAA